MRRVWWLVAVALAVAVSAPVASASQRRAVARAASASGAVASIGRGHVSGTTVTVAVHCRGASGDACVVTVKLTAKHDYETVVVGAQTLTLDTGQSMIASLALNSTGQQLLAAAADHSLTLTLTFKARYTY